MFVLIVLLLETQKGKKREKRRKKRINERKRVRESKREKEHQEKPGNETKVGNGTARNEPAHRSIKQLRNWFCRQSLSTAVFLQHVFQHTWQV